MLDSRMRVQLSVRRIRFCLIIDSDKEKAATLSGTVVIVMDVPWPEGAFDARLTHDNMKRNSEAKDKR